MLRPLHLSALVAALAAAHPAAAQSSLPYNQRVRFAAPRAPLDSTTIELLVRDAATGRPVPALVCFSRDPEVVTDTAGRVRVANLRRRSVPAKVMATGYRVESLILMPGTRGRSYATVGLVADPTALRQPRCADARWP